MSKLSLKQRAFVDEYITISSAYQPVLRAGYKENHAKNTQEELVEKDGKISDYIQGKLRGVQTKKYSAVEEALAVTASITEGEPQRFEVVKRDPYTNEIMEREVSECSAGFKERSQAFGHYYEINAALVGKRKIETSEIPIFIDNINSDDDS